MNGDKEWNAGPNGPVPQVAAVEGRQLQILPDPARLRQSVTPNAPLDLPVPAPVQAATATPVQTASTKLAKSKRIAECA